MRKFYSILLTLCMIAAAAYIITNPLQGTTYLKPAMSAYDITMKQDLLCLMLAYPEHISGVEQSVGKVYILLKSGSRILYDDKKSKTIDVKIANPDLQDMLEQVYPITSTKNLMEKNYDPGRARVYSLLGEVYGGSRQQIERKLVSVRGGYGAFQFNGSNKASEALKQAMKELELLAKTRQDIRKCIYPCNGTYNYRVISGTGRLSPHAYGIAIDLARDKRDYWQWASREEGEKRLSVYPSEIVEVFEKNNFIWGGKWGHFDILHFEYRPEIIIKGRYFADVNNSYEQWYEGVPVEDEYVKECIKKIDAEIY